MEIQQFLQQLTMGLNQIEVKGQSNVVILAFLMNLTNEFNNDLMKQKQQEEIAKQQGIKK